jgi:hypothetical protein
VLSTLTTSIHFLEKPESWNNEGFPGLETAHTHINSPGQTPHDINIFLSRNRLELFPAHNLNNSYINFNFISHNINGIKSTNHKLYTLLEWASQHNINIIALQETI